MSQPDHILIVDDDPEIRQLLSTYLEEAGLRTSVAADGREMRRRLDEQLIDLVVLDLMLPGEDGLTLCRDLRVHSNIPVIMLTARGTLVDRIVGLEMGADDYLGKPFDPRELLARIKVVLRRTHSFPERARMDEARHLHFAGWQLETTTRQLRSPAGLVISLGNSDYRVLRLLLQHPNRPLSRDFLLGQVFERERMPYDRSIDVCISRLRQHLDDAPKAAALIRTVRNEGYMLTVDAVHSE
ncbi:response regulator [Pseudomonas sp. 148P]|uniref:Response regulator n=1 Tax=Pseudomonas ulcerans TaxID=3115852 RepID=A0ABU7HQX1_9PSED|nr:MULTISPECIES: response regulator [unclassified Pseudomonas]MEE1922957.1 response regulator [Pseudomonas sp. 147P]MEE1933919.1 response regulator [Pseudomonas sp. 148P]